MARYATLPSLAALRSFEAAARHESYTMAAEELGVTQGAVSRQVHELEAEIGVSLFRRVGRAVRLTDAGKTLFADIAGDLDHLQASVGRAVSAGQSATVLSVAVLPTFASRWLVPRLGEFKALHPGIEISLTSRSEPFDLEQERFDLAIHYGRADWPGAVLTPLCPEDLVVVAAPTFVDANPTKAPETLFDLPLLHLTSRSGLWANYYQQRLGAGKAAFPGPRFDQFSMIISGALAGLGLAILPTYLIEDELSSGSLVQIDRLDQSRDEGYFVATPVGARNAPALQLINWMRRQVSNRPRWHG